MSNRIIAAIEKARKIAKSQGKPSSVYEIAEAINLPAQTVYSFLKSENPNAKIAAKIFELYDIQCVIIL